MSATVYFASDHAGFPLKEALSKEVADAGYKVEDCGAFSLDPSDDYPDFVTVCAQKVAKEEGSFGIVFGASGQGEAMCANRVQGVRAAVFYGSPKKEQVDAGGEFLSLIASVRRHNDARILALGARFLSLEEARDAVFSFLTTPFSSDERHSRRLAKF